MNITKGKIESAQKVVLYGPEGIGKSTFAAHFPDPLFIDTEGSTKHMNVRRFDAPASWSALIEEVRYVRDHPGECKTLVIDTADWAEQLCIQHVLKTYEKGGIEAFNYGKGYVYVAEEFGRLLNLLNDVIDHNIHVVLTAHAKMRKFELPDEMGSYDRWELKLSKLVAPMIKEWGDMVLFANYKTLLVKDGKGESAKNKAVGGQRVMHTSHHPCWDAKNRHGLPDELPFDFAQIAACFPSDAAIVEAPAPVPAPAPAEPGPKSEVNVKQINIPADLPPELCQLMAQDGIDEAEIREAVAQKGYYPINTPISQYDSGFISGALIAGWAQLKPVILNNRDLPF